MSDDYTDLRAKLESLQRDLASRDATIAELREELKATKDRMWETGHENDALRAKLEALEAHKAAAPLCEKHAPNGGARTGCLVCSGMKLSAALSRIDYLCGEPNDMECSGYDIHFNEDAVVENVRKLQARVRELQQYHDWAAPQIERPVEQSVIAENNALSAKLEAAEKDAARYRWLFGDADCGKTARVLGVYRMWNGQSDWDAAVDVAIAAVKAQEEGK